MQSPLHRCWIAAASLLKEKRSASLWISADSIHKIQKFRFCKSFHQMIPARMEKNQLSSSKVLNQHNPTASMLPICPSQPWTAGESDHRQEKISETGMVLLVGDPVNWLPCLISTSTNMSLLLTLTNLPPRPNPQKTLTGLDFLKELRAAAFPFYWVCVEWRDIMCNRLGEKRYLWLWWCSATRRKRPRNNKLFNYSLF